MKQKVSRGLCGKVQDNFSFKRNGCEADRRAPPVGFEISNGETERDGAREVRWSPAAIHGEAGGSGGTSVFSTSFRVGGWWSWSPAGTTSTAALAPADGGSGSRGPRQRELLGSNWSGG